MIKVKKQNIFAAESKVIVNPVNTMGVMGKGLALGFKERFPENYDVYRADCRNKDLKIGHPTIYSERGYTIINFPTKRHWKDNSKMSYIETGLDGLIEIIKKEEIKVINMPFLGCGLGNLDKAAVHQLIEAKLGEMDVEVIINIPVKYTFKLNVASKDPFFNLVQLRLKGYKKSEIITIFAHNNIELSNFDTYVNKISKTLKDNDLTLQELYEDMIETCDVPSNYNFMQFLKIPKEVN